MYYAGGAKSMGIKGDFMYDNNNIFAKIIRGDAPSTKIYEDDYALAFQNIAPRAKTHILIIPKGEYTDIYDFTANAPTELQSGFWNAVRKTVEKLGVSGNFRAVANTGAGAGQSVFHFHLHIMSDERFKTDF